ncbi:MAG: arylesterase [Hyphomicrobiaceae bacterium]|nr:arylesterase [Hyphomicrobiaceae bacterium]
MLSTYENNRSWSVAGTWRVVRFGLALGLVLMALSAAMSLANAKPRALTIVVLGDSLTAGYGLAAENAFPAQLEAALKRRGHAVTIVNAGVSGDTTAAGLQRLDWAVPDGTDGVILELGANDALRGLSPITTRDNLRAILNKLKARKIPVLIAGMKSPGNWGTAYIKAFDGIFPDLASSYGHDLYPFFLEGVAVRKEFNQPDGLHPTAKGVAEIVRRILPTAERFLKRVRERQDAK